MGKAKTIALCMLTPFEDFFKLFSKFSSNQANTTGILCNSAPTQAFSTPGSQARSEDLVILLLVMERSWLLGAPIDQTAFQLQIPVLLQPRAR
jgi:hypothetical protein